jgi:serine/threonine protein phosphatase PrpC
MGAMLEKPCMTTVVERQANRQFVCAVSELNGYRNNMEDAHVIDIRDDWGAFGVFDGHGGDACSKWIADRFVTEFKENGCPKDDPAAKDLWLRIDREYLDTKQPSGTTATMCIVHKPTTAGGKHGLFVINAGDSRVLLGRRDGTIVDGNGTDEGLTTDHKPNHPSERQRIEANGGHVEIAAGGVARLNGDLAVSRGFGDAEYKKQGADPLDLEKQPATASPEIGHFECDELDFLLLVCDGVSEGDFSNAEVVQLAAEHLREHGDAGVAATAIVHKAVQRNSKDNVTCMIVLLQGSDDIATTKILNPGPFSSPSDNTFMKAYEAMAGRGGKTLVQAVELRYEQCRDGYVAKGTEDEETEANQKKDLETIGSPEGEKGSEERTNWFRQRIEQLQREGQSAGTDGSDGLPAPLAALLRARGIAPDAISHITGRGAPATNKKRAGVKVRMPALDVFKEAIERNSSLKWDTRMEALALMTGLVEEDDESDGTTKVKFEGVSLKDSGSMIAWIPSEILVEAEESTDVGSYEGSDEDSHEVPDRGANEGTL